MDRLQDFEFDRSNYERPQQKWHCGHKQSGQTCRMGPDTKGHCRAGPQCQPFRKGDRWQCTRANMQGGACEEGPLADGQCSHHTPVCKPLQSQRSQRGQISKLAVLMAFLLLLLMLSSPLRSGFVNPGPLANVHSTKAVECGSCHDARTAAPEYWLHLAFANTPAEQANHNCLRCHKLGDTAHLPHNVEVARLQQLSRQRGVQNVVALASHHAVACATCHREHQGQRQHLSEVADKACTGCHVTRVSRFGSDHPDIKAFAYREPTPIIFDHQAHIDEYFKDDKVKANAPASGCLTCHRLQGKQKTMHAFSFEKQCFACHKKDVTGEGFIDPGIRLIGLPGLDLDSLSKQGIPIGSWPSALEDQELSPWLMFLLAADPKLHAVLDQLSQGKLILTELESADATILKQVQALIWAIKNSYVQLAQGSTESWLQQLQAAAGRPLRDDERLALSAYLPQTLLRQTSAAWLARWQRELALWQAGQPPASEAINIEAIESTTEPAPGDWYSNEYALYYRPKGHKDPNMQYWLAIAAEQSQTPTAKRLLKLLGSKDAPGQCIRCHRLEATTKGHRIHWLAPHNKAGSFTQFNHQPHLTALKSDDCRYCHVFNQENLYKKALKDTEAKIPYQGNFTPMAKTLCQQCHHSSGVGDECSRCHTYHGGKTPLNTTALP